MPKIKKSVITFMGAIVMMATSMGATNSNNTTDGAQHPDKPKKTSAAARRTVGNIIECQDGKSTNPNLSITDYYIDQDGDGRADVVRQFINRDGNVYYSQIMYSPFSVLNIIEVYDKKHNMWNIVDIQEIGTRKPKSVPVYIPTQKTR